MRRPALVACAFLVVGVFATSCGSDSAQMADTVPAAASGEPKPDRPMGVDEETDPHTDEWMKQDQQFFGWLRSDYVKNLDVNALRKAEDQGSWTFGPATFEEAVDKADLVCRGQ